MGIERSPTIIASRYRILRELGRGGMGVVYLVEHVHTGDHLALKLLLGQGALNGQLVERFKREARASAKIRSENVVRVVDADVAPELSGAPFLVMELLDGCDFEKLVQRRGRIPPLEVVSLLHQAARALDKAHALGIVHRDLKPENLFLHTKEDGAAIVKIVDFGISKFIDPTGDIAGAGMTSTGSVMGTPLYMAPEQARGRVTEIGPQTDVWAMGLVAIHLLTSEIYWNANTVAELMAQIIAEPMYAPSSRWPWLPSAFDVWFAKACARSPRDRFATVGEQIGALAAALGTASPVSVSASGQSMQPLAEAARTTSGASVLARSMTKGRTHAPPARGKIFLGSLAVAAIALGASIASIVALTTVRRDDPSKRAAAAEISAPSGMNVPSAASPVMPPVIATSVVGPSSPADVASGLSTALPLASSLPAASTSASVRLASSAPPHASPMPPTHRPPATTFSPTSL